MWPAVENLIKAAYNGADEDVPPDLMADLLARRRQLWAVWDGRKFIAAALTRVITLRSGLACQILACGGTEGEKWVGMISRIEDFAAHAGCRKVLFEGRPGWEKIYPTYRRVRVILEKEIDDGRRRHANHEPDPSLPN